MVIPLWPCVAAQIITGIHTGKGPSWITARKKTIAESSTAKGMPPIVSPIHEMMAVIKADPITPIATPLIDELVASINNRPVFFQLIFPSRLLQDSISFHPGKGR